MTAPGDQTSAPPVAHHPLTADQRRLWFLQQLDPGDTGYHIYLAHHWQGPLDQEALRTALDGLAARHEILRTRFDLVADEPRQLVHPPAPVPLELRTLPPAPAEPPARRLTEAIAPTVNRPFDLAAEAPLRALLVRADERNHAVCLVLHHIAADGWSTGLLWQELLDRYRAALTGADPGYPELPLQYGDYARAERERTDPESEQRAYAHWSDKLAGTELLRLPYDHRRPEHPEHPAAFVDLLLGPELTAAVDRLARQERCTPFTVLLAAYQAVLARWSGQDDFTVGTPVAGRNEVAHEELIGYFTRTTVIRADFRDEPDFRTVLRRVRSATMSALAHSDVPLERLAADLGAPTGGLPFQTLFVLQSRHEGGAHGGPELPHGVTLLGLDSGFAQAKADLLLDTWRTADGLTASFCYDRELFEPATVEALAARYRSLLARVVEDAGLPVHGDWTVDAEERAALLARAAGPELPADRRPVLERFAEQVAARPDAPALMIGEGTVSYRELDRRSDELAARVVAAVGPLAGRAAAVRVAPGVELVTALLAVWKAGGGYLPLEPALPAQRQRRMAADGGAVLLLAAAADGSDDLGLPVLAVESPAGAGPVASAGGAPAVVPLPGSRAGDPAYVLFTSGSTGRPKGVVVEHAALADRVAWMAGDGYRLVPEDRIVQFASVGFDTHAEELWPALAVGACCVLLPGGGATLPDLLRGPAGRQITVLDLPTAYWHELVMLEEAFEWPAALRLVILGGSAVEGAVLARWHARHGDGIRLVNTYGPTEATVIATSAELTAAEFGAGPVGAGPVGSGSSGAGSLGGGAGGRETGRPPIGRPLPGVRCYVLDRRLQLVPDGTEGELWLGGAGLARGYAGRDDLTAESFRPDPFAPDPSAAASSVAGSAAAGSAAAGPLAPGSAGVGAAGAPAARMYRTGDRVRRRADGRLEFLGRVDAQLKLSGRRIEPAEVESVLTSHPAVAGALVLARDGRLLGYVVPVGGEHPRIAELLGFAAESLPAYMVPAGLVVLDRIPLTVNGKPDLAALPDPEPAAAGPEFVAPRSEAEELVAGIWREVLAVERVGALDDFFLLGGNSLLVTRVAARIRAATALEITVRDVFETPVLASLAGRVEELLIAEIEALSDLEVADRLA
ncbi:condensation domain-containing protein [Kitasatospora sp. NPDC057015]|uniref:condensation domain-containing protein n=1 Tax=Kitasatospora sp. NPDC057015 TaxID=3346001 RepID=UPI00362A149F